MLLFVMTCSIEDSVVQPAFHQRGVEQHAQFARISSAYSGWLVWKALAERVLMADRVKLVGEKLLCFWLS